MDLSLCMVVWEASGVDQQSMYFLALFDLNRWYHAQMPRISPLAQPARDESLLLVLLSAAYIG